MATVNGIFTEKRTRNTTDTFRGLKNCDYATDGDLLACENMSSNAYPAICSSPSRRLLSEFVLNGSPGSLGADEKLFYTDESNFYYDGVAYGEVTKGKKHFAMLKDSVAIFPDKTYFKHGKKYYYYHDEEMFEFDHDETINETLPLSAISDTEPASASPGDRYYNTEDSMIYTYLESGVWGEGDEPDINAVYSIDSYEYARLDGRKKWIKGSSGDIHVQTVAYSTDYSNECILIEFTRDGDPVDVGLDSFKVGDRITVKGLRLSGSVNDDELSALASGTVLRAKGLGYITVDNVGNAVNLSTWIAASVKSITIERIVPNLDCAVNVGDRIWGARNGYIYACAPSNILRWGDGNTVSTAVTLNAGVSGEITGCADFGGVPVFFTENSIIKVLRVYNGYSLSVTPAASLSKKCPDSIAFAAGSLYYVSDSGVMRYNGASPKKIVFEPGIPLEGMVGGSDGAKYYLSGAGKTYIYDPQKDVWYSESGEFSCFSRYSSDIIGACEESGSCRLYLLGDTSSELGIAEKLGTRTLEFAPFYENSVSKKTYSRLIIRAKAALGTNAQLSVSFDGGEYIKAATLTGTGKITVYEIPLTPTRADFMQVSIISDSDDLTLISLTREFVLHESYN